MRNIAILAIFARGAIGTAVLPLLAMTAAAAYWIYRDRKKAENLEDKVSLILASPMSLKKYSNLACSFYRCRCWPPWDNDWWAALVSKL
jgi:hypothetical protein